MKLKLILYAGLAFLFTGFCHSQENSDSLNSAQQIFNYRDSYFYENYLSKNSDIEGSGYEEYLHEKYNFEMSKMNQSSDIVYTEQKRWDTYKESKLVYLGNGDKMPASNWINLGPNSIDSFSGKMTCHAFDPVDPEIVWAGSSTGGIWRTINGGDNWTSMTDELPSMLISDIEVNPNNRNVILAGTGTANFTGITIGPGVGVLKSTNNGLSWYQTTFNYQTGQNVAVSKLRWKPESADSVYMASSIGIWLSTNSGDSWSILRNGNISTIEFNNNSPNIIYAMIKAEGVFRSTNAGITWSLLSNGLPTGPAIGYSSLTISKSNPDVLYVSMSDASTFGSLGLFRSADGGSSWNKITNAPNVLCQPNFPTQCQGWYVNVISVSPNNPDLIFYGGVQLWRSSNGGTTWTRHDILATNLANSFGKTYVDQSDIGFDPANPDIIYIFNDGGVQKSVNAGLWWEKKNADLITGQLYRIASSATDTNLIIGGFQDHGLQKLNNANGNIFWTRWSTNDGTNVIIDPTDNNIFYGDYFLGAHYKSTNGGASWQSTFAIQNGITESATFIAPLIMHPSDNTILFTASAARIYKTTNGGSLWIPIADIPNIITMAIDKLNPEIMYAHAYDNSTWALWKSTNSGTNWIQINNASIPTWRVTDLEPDPSVSGVVYATRNSANLHQDHVKKSTDFGETWTNITGNLPDIFVYAISVSPFNGDHIYLATDLGVYASTSGGSDWFEFNTGLPIARTFDIHYHPLDRTVRIATIGRGVWKAKAIDASVGIENISSSVPGDFILHQNYPNPFNPSTKIRFELRKQSDVKIVIYNELGEKIQTLFEGIEVAGEHTLEWKPSEYSSGVYYLRIFANGFSQSIRMVYLK